MRHSRSALRSGTGKDDAKAWCILFACFLNGMLVSIALTPTVYVAAIIEHYDVKKSAGLFMGSLSFTFLFVSGSPASVLLDRMAIRYVLVIGSVLTTLGLILSCNAPSFFWQYPAFVLIGMGIGFTYHSSYLVLPQYFERYVSVAVMAMSIGIAIGTMSYPSLCLILIQYYTWQPSLYIVAGIALNSTVWALLINPEALKRRQMVNTKSTHVADSTVHVHMTETHDTKRHDHSIYQVKQQNGSLSENILQSITIVREDNISVISSIHYVDKTSLLKNKQFLFVLFAVFAWSGLSTIPYVFTAEIYESVELEKGVQRVVFAIFGICNLLGRILAGSGMHFSITTAMRMFITFHLLTTFAVLLLIFSDVLSCLYIFNILIGLSVGGMAVSITLTAINIVKPIQLNYAIACISFTSISSVIVSPLLGFLYDITHGYTASISLMSGLCLASSLPLVFSTFVQPLIK